LAYQVGPKGQVVIPKRLRDELGVRTGWSTIQRIVDGHVEIHFMPPDDGQSLKGSLGAYVKRPVPGGQAWTEARENAWKKGVRSMAPSSGLPRGDRR
jgi:AbrB family looped-hinge helix DNA binding protein